MIYSNFEYIKRFVNKHKYKEQFRVQCYKTISTDNIKYVIFDKSDVPSGIKVSLEDIKYDIDTSLPNDVFYRWLEYRENNPEKNTSYIDWMTKMDNQYTPIGVDNSESGKLKDIIYNKLDELRNMKWF